MVQQKRRYPFRYLEPVFFGGLLDDPLLWLRIRPLGRALLFDCGQIAHLAKRVVKPIDTVFITHAHMDHIMGLPTLIRHHHASPKLLDVYGPPGIAERVYHQLRGYDWNLREPTWCTLRVHEIRPDEILHYSFSGPDGFSRRFDGAEPRTGPAIWACRYATVSAVLLDHKLPVLAFRIDERPHFAIDKNRLEQQGLIQGPWIRLLKNRIWKGEAGAPLAVARRASDDRIEQIADPLLLYEAIRLAQPAAALGYLTDVGWIEENIARIADFLGNLTLLCAECAFLIQDEAKARVSYHLCTSDLNALTQRLQPRYLLAMHLSKSYLRRCAELYRELQPPAATTILQLPPHLVPPPLFVDDVASWLRTPMDTQSAAL